jgi:hypothetical protein
MKQVKLKKHQKPGLPPQLDPRLQGQIAQVLKGRISGFTAWGYSFVDGKWQLNLPEAGKILAIFAASVRGFQQYGRKVSAVDFAAALVTPGQSVSNLQRRFYRTLENEIYTGTYTFRGLKFFDRVPVIVPRELWDRVQAINRTRAVAHPPAATIRHLYQEAYTEAMQWLSHRPQGSILAFFKLAEKEG